VGEDHRLLLPTSALAGALILSLASIASKTLIDGVLIPVGIVTALVGIPFFMAIVARTRSKSV
jgi:iron complex transport system permease protein